MPHGRMKLNIWAEHLGEAAALSTVPMLLGVSPGTVRWAVRSRLLPVHTFRAADGRVFRRVRLADLRRLDRLLKQGPSWAGMARALRLMVAQEPQEDVSPRQAA